METKKVRVDTNSNAEDPLMGSNVVIQYYPNIDFPRVEIPKCVTLATLSSVSVEQVEAKIVILSIIKVLQSGKLRMIQAHLLDPSDTKGVVLW